MFSTLGSSLPFVACQINAWPILRALFVGKTHEESLDHGFQSIQLPVPSQKRVHTKIGA